MKRKPVPVFFHYQTIPFYFRHRGFMKAFLMKLFKKEGKEVEQVNYIFCSDEQLLAINQQYLNHDYYTDIITFELSPKGHALISDIYISVDRVRDNARLLNDHFSNELRRIIIHGALHLCGYQDKTPQSKKEMTVKEDFYLKQYKVSRGTVN